jgi:murein DD-endopeptidase MepM/ murein hydrolase activator NlpD
MGITANLNNETLAVRFRKFFTTRDFIFHDGRDLRRFSIAGRTQALLAGAAAVTVLFSAYGVSQAAFGAIAITGVAGVEATPEAKMAHMRAEMARMEADVVAIKQATKAHAARVEQRQRLISAVLSGKGQPEELGASVPAAAEQTSAVSDVIAPLRKVENRQVKVAMQVRQQAQARLTATAYHMRLLGLRPERYVAGAAMGGPFEAATPADVAASASSEATADAQFRSLFLTWKKLDVLEQTVISIPSLQPVDNLRFTSNFGVRSDPFRGTAAMHGGVDIPGPIGSPIYATADGVVSRAERAGGYGNLVQINHGKGIETRYGHLSKILVAPNTRVRRGQLIALMGSTGRSTGSHLHYEVRIDGAAVNPVPFLQTADYLVAIQDRAVTRQVAVGGPAN